MFESFILKKMSVFVQLSSQIQTHSNYFVETQAQIRRIIGPEFDHWQCLSLTDSLTDWLTDGRLVNLIDVTLVCEDGNSKLVEVVTVVDVDAEDNVGNSLSQIWELMFGSKAKLLFRLWAQGLLKILKLKFRQDFANDRTRVNTAIFTGIKITKQQSFSELLTSITNDQTRVR